MRCRSKERATRRNLPSPMTAASALLEGRREAVEMYGVLIEEGRHVHVKIGFVLYGFEYVDCRFVIIGGSADEYAAPIA